MTNKRIHEIYAHFNYPKAYAILFGEPPQTLDIVANGKDISESSFKELWKELRQKYSRQFTFYTSKFLKKSNGDDNCSCDGSDCNATGVDDTIKFNSFLCVSKKLKVVLNIHKSLAHISYNKKNKGSFLNEVKNMLYPYYQTKKEECAYVSLISKDNCGFFTKKFEIKTVDFKLDAHYNDDFLKEHNKIENFLTQKGKSGLVLLHGVPGTGKTYYIRYLIANNKKVNMIYLPNHLMASLASPDFVTFMGNLGSNTILLIEDAEEILKPRTENNNGAISNLLNMTDGILGDCFSLKIFASFNSNLDEVDSALLRKGRLVSKYEFKPLSVNKTRNLLKELNLNRDVSEPMTLSEIYNYTSDSYEENNKIKAGFILPEKLITLTEEIPSNGIPKGVLNENSGK